MPSNKSKARSRVESIPKSSNVVQGAQISESQDVAEGCDSNPPCCWPTSTKYSALPVLSPWLNERQRQWLHHKPAVFQLGITPNSGDCTDALPVVRLPFPQRDMYDRVSFRQIEQSEHPAHGQFGLFACRSLSPEEIIIPYIGYIHSSTESEQSQFDTRLMQNILDGRRDDQQDEMLRSGFAIGSWDASDYDLNMVREEGLELAVDAAQLGNEARFCNDYRGVPLSELSASRSTNPCFGRRSKRTAKSWSEHGAHQSEDRVKYTNNTSIPNAEFKDVWFEWSAEVGANALANIGQTASSLQSCGPATDAVALASATNFHAPRTTPLRKKKVGMRGVAIFVLPAGKSGKRKSGIAQGQEILVSYGKGFWAHHGSNVSEESVEQEALHQRGNGLDGHLTNGLAGTSPIGLK